MRQEINEQFRNAIDEFERLWKRSDISSNARMPAREFLEFRNIVGIGKKTDVEDKIAVRWHAVAETEAIHIHDYFLGVLSVLELPRNQPPKLVDVQFGRVDAQVREFPDGS